MVFSSVPLYLDHPNWHQLQQPNNQQGSGSENPQLPQPPPPPLQVSGGGGGSVRPGSMVDRARLAKLPQPEAGLKCPRCESTNTKFCYFNNYNLSQPRHFCKTCRRYWTRGGALRNVPVGGGCRRNKRSSKSSSSGSKSQATTTITDNQTGPKSTSPSPSSHFHQPPPPFMATLQNLSQYGGGFMAATVGGSGGGGISDMGFQIGTNSGGNSNILSNFLAGFDPNSNLYTYQSEGFEAPCSGTGQLAAQGNVEETRGLNLSSQLTGIPENNQYWVGNNAWPENNSMSLSFHHCHGKMP